MRMIAKAAASLVARRRASRGVRAVLALLLFMTVSAAWRSLGAQDKSLLWKIGQDVVGAAHLVGKKGVVDMLKARGFSVEQR